MKFKNILPILFGIAVFSSCIDEGAADLIDFTPFVPAEDTSYVDLDTFNKAITQPKNVLIEDFTGVQCSNCPDAAKKIKEIKEKHPGRIVSMGIYAGAEVFTNPKSGHSTYDFRTQDGNNIAKALGASGNLPEGSVDRVLFDGEESITTSRFIWLGNTETRLAENNPVTIDVNVSRADADTLIILVRVLYMQSVEDDANFLAVYLSEDGLIDYQYDIFEGDIEDYEHDHVFRKSLTSPSGDSLVVKGNTSPYIEGRVFQRRFLVPVKKDVEGEEYRVGWNFENLNVVACVAKKNTDDLEVIHVIEKHLSE